MPNFDVEHPTDEQALAAWKRASFDVATTGQSRAIRGKVMTLANAAEIREQIRFYEGRIAANSRKSRTNLSRHKRPS